MPSNYFRLIDEAVAREKSRQTKSRQLCGSRHPSFGGTFVVKNQKSISGSHRVYHRKLASECVCVCVCERERE